MVFITDELSRKLLDSTGSIIVLLNIDQTVELINKKTTEILGFTIEDFQGKSWFDTVTSEEKKHKYKREFLSFVKGKNKLLENEEIEVIAKDGEKKIIAFRITELLDENNNITHILGSGEDITELRKKELELRKEEYRLQKYLDIADVMLLVLDKKMCVSHINKKGYEILGYEKEEIVGMNWLEKFIPERVKDNVKQVFESVFNQELEFRDIFENPIVTKDGEERIIAWHNTLLINEDGRSIGTLSSGTDITDKKLAENNQKKSDEKYRNLVEKAKVLICRLEVDGKILLVNPFIKEITGYDVKELIGRNWWQILYPGRLKNQVKNLYDELKYHDVSNYEMTLQTKNSEFRTINWSSNSIRSEEGNIIEINGIGVDITNQKEFEEGLRESKEKYQSIVDTSYDSIYEASIEGEITYQNPRSKELYGYSPEEIVGKDSWKISDPTTLAEVKSRWEKLVENQKPFEKFESTIIHKEGHKVFIESRGLPFLNKNNEIVGFRIFEKDITEHKEMEMLRREAYVQIEQNISNFAVLVDKIRNPLAVIVGIAEIHENTMMSKILEHSDAISKIMEEISRRWDESEKFRLILQEQLLLE